MTKEATLSFIRHALTFGGGWIMPAGFVAESEMQAAVGAIMTLIGLSWSWYDKWQRENA